jgi:uncharacterized protein (DUF111 family)
MVEGCEVRVKRGLLDGEPVTVQAEYADAAAAAERLGLPVRAVLERAVALARGGAVPRAGAPSPHGGEPS